MQKEKIVETTVRASYLISSAIVKLQRVALDTGSMEGNVRLCKDARDRVKGVLEIVNKDLLGKTKS